MTLTSKRNKITVIIVYFGKLPKWFDIWVHTAKLNDGIDFHLFGDSMPHSDDLNIFYHKMSIADFNQLNFMASSGLNLTFPYKVCDFRPLIAETFPELVSKYQYWGWGDLDVIYGDILAVLGASFGRFDYISTGWQGESGPLAFLKNSPQINNLWRLIPNVHAMLSNDKYTGIDEHDFVSILRDKFSCDIVFRECLEDLPAEWKNGRLVSFSNTEYALYHFGGDLPGAKKEVLRKSGKVSRHLKRNGSILIDATYHISLEGGRLWQLKRLLNHRFSFPSLPTTFAAKARDEHRSAKTDVTMSGDAQGGCKCRSD